MIDVTIPAQGVAMEEAVLLEWFKQPGEEVALGEALAEIETDKATADLESPAAGILGRHRYAEGDTVPVGELLTRVLEPGEREPDDAAAAPGPNAPAPATGPPARAPAAAADAAAPSSAAGAPDDGPRRLSPRARRAAAAAAAAPASTAPADGTTGRHRALIAAKVTESWQTIPHFTVTREIDATALLAATRELRERVPALTVTDLLLRALAAAHGPGTDLGVAVATEHGVMIPVVRDVLGLDQAELAEQRAAAVARGRSGRLGPEDRESPSSTLSNLGPFGVDQFTGILASGQPSLLTVGRAAPRVVAGPEGPETRRTFFATLNADHRVLDGADAAALLVRFAEATEDHAFLTNEETPAR